jgi:tetratricopeptide (TPR) repeat protein
MIPVAVPGAVFERFLSPERPMDRVIMQYMELEKEGKATSMDLANLGVLILEKGFVHDAEAYLRKALDLDKNNYEASYRLGLVLQRDGRDREAVRCYKHTVKLRPGYAQARFMLALAEERCGRRDAAIHDYVRAYRHAPDLANPLVNPLVYDSRLQTEAMLGHYRETVASTTLKVTEVDPETVRRMLEALPPEERPTPAPPVPQPPDMPVPQGTQAQPPASAGPNVSKPPAVRQHPGLPGGLKPLPPLANVSTPPPSG